MTGERGQNNTNSLRSVLLQQTGRSSHGSFSLLIVFLAIHLIPGTLLRDPLKSLWGEVAYKNYGRNIGLILLSTVTCTAMRGLVRYMRYEFHARIISIYIQTDRYICPSLNTNENVSISSNMKNNSFQNGNTINFTTSNS